MLTPIATRYRGYAFRSRREARWAVLFDELRIEWNYEAEGFVLPSGCYLPDFWLPRWRAFAEVKGGPALWDGPALVKVAELARESQLPVLLLDDIRPARHFESVLAAQGEHLEPYTCDIMESLVRERVWYRFDPINDIEEPAAEDWISACEAALTARFGRGAQG